MTFLNEGLMALPLAISFKSMGVRLFPVDQLEVDHYIVALREQLDEETCTAAWAEGKAMTLEQAVAYALSDD